MRHIQWIIIFLMAGCSLGPNYHAPKKNLPSGFSGSTSHFSPEKKIIPFWQKASNDPLLVALIHQGLRGGNWDVQTAYATIRQARAELSITSAAQFPEITLPGKISRDKLSGNSEILVSFPQGVVPLNYTDYQLGFDASWELDFFGHVRHSVEASRARFESTIDNQYAVSLSTAAEIARVYTLYRVTQQRIVIANQTLHSYQETEKLVRLQQDAGVASDVDLKRIQSEVLSTKATIPPLEADAKSTVASLAVLVGEYPESLMKKLNHTGKIPVMNPKMLSVGLPSDLLERRPDIRMAERNLAAATADIGVKRAEQFPRFMLLGDFGSETTVPGSFFQSVSRYWSVGPQMTAPLFNAGRLKNAVNAQIAAGDIAYAEYQQTVLQALSDVESNLIRYDRERARQQALVAAQHKLQETLKLVQLQYRAGQTTLLDVLDVQRQLNGLADQRVQSLGQITTDLMLLYKSLGGDWIVE